MQPNVLTQNELKDFIFNGNKDLVTGHVVNVANLGEAPTSPSSGNSMSFEELKAFIEEPDLIWVNPPETLEHVYFPRETEQAIEGARPLEVILDEADTFIRSTVESVTDRIQAGDSTSVEEMTEGSSTISLVRLSNVTLPNGIFYMVDESGISPDVTPEDAALISELKQSVSETLVNYGDFAAETRSPYSLCAQLSSTLRRILNPEETRNGYTIDATHSFTYGANGSQTNGFSILVSVEIANDTDFHLIEFEIELN